MKHSVATRVFGILAIIALIVTALAPVAYVLAPQLVQQVETSPE